MKIDTVDLYPAFLQYWSCFCDASPQEQVKGWAEAYMHLQPRVFELAKADYASLGVEWDEVLRSRILPRIPLVLQNMGQIHDIILGVLPQASTRMKEVFGFQEPIIAVIYVGIGSGAGWAVQVQGGYHVLLGLESLAENHWCDPAAVFGLVCHELGHVYHQWLRWSAAVSEGVGPFWQLYEEGFAQWAEWLLLGKRGWHQELGEPGWVSWCSANLKNLARTFLSLAGNGTVAVRPFFGSWYEVDGHKESGYYLGFRAIKQCIAQRGLLRTALLNPGEVEEEMQHVLRDMLDL